MGLDYQNQKLLYISENGPLTFWVMKGDIHKLPPFTQIIMVEQVLH